MPPHIYAFTYIFCYLCIHYSKGNVSCFTCIKLYKLEAWPDFVPRHGDAAATAPAPDVPCPWGARGRCVFGPRGAARWVLAPEPLCVEWLGASCLRAPAPPQLSHLGLL